MKCTQPNVVMRAVAIATLLVFTVPAGAANEALLELFRILEQKGSLSKDEYQLLVNAAEADEEKSASSAYEAREEVKQQIASVEANNAKMGWAEKIMLKGDLRTRYLYQDEDGRDDRGRGRIRYRLGVIAKPTPGWEVGAGLASGGSDQRSTNQSFDASFSTKGINLDYAYLQYGFDNGVNAVAGKFKRKKYLYAPTDVMWDTDINPEGFSVNYTGSNTWGGFFANGGIWVLEENSASSDDPFMGYGQIGQKWKSDEWSGTLAAAVYGFSNADVPADFAASEGTNTDADLSSVNLAGEVSRKVGKTKVRLLGEFINNFDTDTSADTAWAIGTKITWQKWNFKYLYADVEANSVPDFLPDSDRFDGLTGTRGHEFEIKYSLMENVTLGLDLYAVEDMATEVDQQVLQADLSVKF